MRSAEDIQRIVERAVRDRTAISVSGGRHAMGAQQFGTDTLPLDMCACNRVLNFDSGSGLVEVEAGIQSPELIEASLAMQAGLAKPWGII
jgi:FAD/FMN-containing dehydrogenase